jgi:hypothetical protein
MVTQPLQVLIACEFTGVVRDAFLDAGHDAWSCDLLPAETPSNRHIMGDVRDVLTWAKWDLLMVAHPPCTRLCNSGVRWLDEPPGKLSAEHYSDEEIEAYRHMNRKQRLAFMWEKLDEGAELFSDLWNADVPRIAIENPIMHKHAKGKIRNYEDFAQSVQPWQHGDFETKRTCLWLRNLPTLAPKYPTLHDARRGLRLADDAMPENRVHSASPGPDRWKERSRFFPGIARAMAEQWGGVIQAEAA